MQRWAILSDNSISPVTRGSREAGVKKSGFNLRDRKFRTVFWGADRREVQAAIDAVAAEYERVQAELRQISEEREALAREIERIIELDRSVVRVLVAAEEDAGVKRAAARRHSTALVAQAEEQAATLLRQSERERDGLRQELSAYVERRQHAVRTLNALIGQMGTKQEAPAPPPAHQDAVPSLKLVAPAAGAPPAATAPGQAEPRSDDWLAGVEQNLRAAARELRAPQIDPGDPSEAETQELLHEAPEAAAARPSVQPPVSAQEPAVTTNVSGDGRPLADQVETAAPSTAATGPHGAGSPDDHAPPALVAPTVDGSPGTSVSEVGAVSENTDLSPSRRRLSRRWVAVAGLAAAAAIAIAVGLPGMGGSKPAGQAVRLRPGTGQTPAAATAAPPAAAPGAKPDGQPTGSAGTQAPAALNVRLRPLRECWVRVTVDGRSDERTLQPGEDIMLRGQQHVVLRVGDAGALAVELNGKPLPPLGADGQVVNKRIDASSVGN